MSGEIRIQLSEVSGAGGVPDPVDPVFVIVNLNGACCPERVSVTSTTAVAGDAAAAAGRAEPMTLATRASRTITDLSLTFLDMCPLLPFTNDPQAGPALTPRAHSC
jgi:hypothetical protein